ncbi:hypothetical protein [Bacillus cereus]|uniref:Lipoprotein n=1 Tax=Bacillus cereus TaxID=1396 RepID=A0A164P7S0_BACCE|nr:hypothetical protein [Bacillus cereus]KZD66367.1 hypothetical protein B4088_2483 [Bacillus cereus]
MKKALLTGLVLSTILVTTGCQEKTIEVNEKSSQTKETQQLPEEMVKEFGLYSDQKTNLSVAQLKENQELRQKKYPGIYSLGTTSADPYNWRVVKPKEINQLKYGKVDLIALFKNYDEKFQHVVDETTQKEALEWARDELKEQLPNFKCSFVSAKERGNGTNAYLFKDGKNSIMVEVFEGSVINLYINGNNDVIKNLITESYTELPKDYSEGHLNSNYYKTDKFKIEVETNYNESKDNYYFGVFKENLK